MADYRLFEPSQDHISQDPSQDQAHNNPASPRYPTTIKRNPITSSLYAPLTDTSTPPYISSPSSHESLLEQAISAADLSDASNTNPQRGQAELTEKHDPMSENHTQEEANWWSRLTLDQWILELFATFISLGALASIFGVLLGYDQKPEPDLPRGITFNAIISFLATISRTAIMVSVSATLSQCKWLWFKKQRKLEDLQIIENASRGPLGSMLMLFSGHGGVTAYLAAIVTIGALGFDTFVQQLLNTEYRVVPEAAHGISINSTTSVTADIAAALGYPETSVQVTAAMVAGVQQQPQAPSVQAASVLDRRSTSQILNANPTSHSSTSPLKPTCPSGNCVWSNYYTLDVCARCENTTKTTSLKNLTPEAASLEEMIQVALQNRPSGSAVSRSSFTWELIPKIGNSVRFNSSLSSFVNSKTTSNEPTSLEYHGKVAHKIIWPLNVAEFSDIDFFDSIGWTPKRFAGIDGPVLALAYAELGFDPNSGLPYLNDSMECALTYCVNEYNTSVVEGNLEYNILSTDYGTVKTELGYTTMLNWSAEVNGNSFAVDSMYYGSGISTLAQLMIGQSTYSESGFCRADQDWTCSDPPVESNSGNYSSVAWQGIDLTANFSGIVEDANNVVSQIFQQYGDNSVNGENFITKTFVVVQWGWIALPLTIVLLGILTLGLAVWETKRSKTPLWKSSLFPLIYRYKGDDNKPVRQTSSPSSGLRSPVQMQMLSTGSGLQSNLVSTFQVQAESSLMSLSKVESEQGLWMLQSTRDYATEKKPSNSFHLSNWQMVRRRGRKQNGYDYEEGESGRDGLP